MIRGRQEVGCNGNVVSWVAPRCLCVWEGPQQRCTCPSLESWSGDEATELSTLACCARAVLSVSSCTVTGRKSATGDRGFSMWQAIRVQCEVVSFANTRADNETWLGGAAAAYRECGGVGEVGEERGPHALARGGVVAGLVVQDAHASTHHLRGTKQHRFCVRCGGAFDVAQWCCWWGVTHAEDDVRLGGGERVLQQRRRLVLQVRHADLHAIQQAAKTTSMTLM